MGRKNHKTLAEGFPKGYGGGSKKTEWEQKLLPKGTRMIYNKGVTSFLSGSATERRVRARNK